MHSLHKLHKMNAEWEVEPVHLYVSSPKLLNYFWWNLVLGESILSARQI